MPICFSRKIIAIATATAVRTYNESRDVPAERYTKNSFALIDVSTTITAKPRLQKGGDSITSITAFSDWYEKSNYY